MSLIIDNTPVALDIKPGEKLIGCYTDPEGKLTVAILLPGEMAEGNWKSALDWAKEKGGDLPNRIEALMLFERHRDEFQRDAYWTNTQRADGSSYAWSQYFDDGDQDDWRKVYELLARAVRRVTI